MNFQCIKIKSYPRINGFDCMNSTGPKHRLVEVKFATKLLWTIFGGFETQSRTQFFRWNSNWTLDGPETDSGLRLCFVVNSGAMNNADEQYVDEQWHQWTMLTTVSSANSKNLDF